MLLLGKFYSTWIAFDPILQRSRFRVGVTWKLNGVFDSVDFASPNQISIESIHKAMTAICEREIIETY